jgi:hypothetical protein
MITLIIIFITLSYVVLTVKNNSGSCDSLSSDQSVNDLCLHYIHMVNKRVKMYILQNIYFGPLLLNFYLYCN